MRNFLIAFTLLSFSSYAQTTVFSEDFASGIPAGFTIIDNDGLTPHSDVSEFIDAWISVAEPDSVTNMVAASTSYFDPAGTADRWLITPAISLGSFGNFVTWNGRSQDASFLDTYYILISTTGTTVADFNDTLAIVVSEGFEWSSHELDLSENGYDGQTVYLAFVNKTNDGFKLYIDDIEVRVDDPVRVNELTNIDLSIYPNPCHEMLHYKAESFIEARLFNLNGGLMVITDAQQMNVSSLTDGVYILEVRTAFGAAYKRIIKR